MLSGFFKKIGAFFAATLAFVGNQTGLNDSIITFLEKQKLTNVSQSATNKAQEELNKEQADVNEVTDGKIIQLNERVELLGAVKGNWEIMLYEYESDANPFKPAMKVVEGLDVYPTASEMFDYVVQKTGEVIANGRKYLVRFSGDVPCPIVVNDKLMTGDGGEGFLTTISEAGARTYNYESNPDTQKLEAIASESEKATVVLKKANETTMPGFQNRMDLLNQA